MATASNPSSGLSTGTAAGAATDRVFLRKASGLIKTAGTLDVFIYNIGTISIGIGIGGILLYGYAVYPGANLPVGAVIACVAMAMICGGMIAWTLTIPRSGGIYPFGSRALPPWIAFMVSFVENICWIFLLTLGAYWVTNMGIAPTVTAIGSMSGTHWITSLGTALAKPGWTFLVSTLVLLLAGWILISGMKRFFFSQKIVFTTAMIGSIVLIVVLATTSRAGFVHNFNHYYGPTATYRGVIADAHRHGWSLGTSSFKNTLLASNWFFLPLIGAAYSIAIGGEIKSSTKAQPLGMLGAIAISMVVWVLTMVLANHVFGKEFLGAIGNNSLNGLESTPSTPWAPILGGVASGSVVLTVILGLSFICWIWMWVPAMQAYVERAMLAWSFDRAAPGSWGKVSQRTHTPVVAIAIVTALCILALVGICFWSFFATMVIFIETALVAWGVVLAAGVVFPFRRPDIYEKSPIAGRRILGLPLMSVLCGLGTIGAALYFVLTYMDNFAAGHEPKRLAVLVGCFVVGAAWFFVTVKLRRRQGIDMSLAFKEIPIE